MLCLSCYYSCLLFKKIGEEGRKVSAWKLRGEGGEGEGGGQGGRNGPNNVCTCEYMKKKKNQWVKEYLFGLSSSVFCGFRFM
jgi:hypothetical protein